jgi:hypothetical protein
MCSGRSGCRVDNCQRGPDVWLILWLILWLPEKDRRVRRSRGLLIGPELRATTTKEPIMAYYFTVCRIDQADLLSSM